VSFCWSWFVGLNGWICLFLNVQLLWLSQLLNRSKQGGIALQFAGAWSSSNLSTGEATRCPAVNCVSGWILLSLKIQCYQSSTSFLFTDFIVYSYVSMFFGILRTIKQSIKVLHMSHIWRFSHRWGGELVHRLAWAAARASQCRTSQCHRNPVVPRYATLCHPVVPSGCAIRLCHPVVPSGCAMFQTFRRLEESTWCGCHLPQTQSTTTGICPGHKMLLESNGITSNDLQTRLQKKTIFQNACTEAQWKDLANSSGHESLLVSCPVSIRKWYAAGWDSVCQF